VRRVRHQHIVAFHEAFIDKDPSDEGKLTLILAFEFAQAGDLKRQLRKARERRARFDERVVWKYFAQVAAAVACMHGQRVMHRDLKPANIFLTLDGTVKVGDLGLGRFLSDQTLEAHSKVGTPLYMAPEVLKGSGYGVESDVWSLGCILYELAMLRSPFKEEGLSLYQLFQKVASGKYPPVSSVYSPTLRRVVAAALSLEPSERPAASELLEVAEYMRDQMEADRRAKEEAADADRRAKADAAAGAADEDAGGAVDEDDHGAGNGATAAAAPDAAATGRSGTRADSPPRAERRKADRGAPASAGGSPSPPRETDVTKPSADAASTDRQRPAAPADGDERADEGEPSAPAAARAPAPAPPLPKAEPGAGGSGSRGTRGRAARRAAAGDPVAAVRQRPARPASAKRRGRSHAQPAAQSPPAPPAAPLRPVPVGRPAPASTPVAELMAAGGGGCSQDLARRAEAAADALPRAIAGRVGGRRTGRWELRFAQWCRAAGSTVAGLRDVAPGLDEPHGGGADDGPRGAVAWPELPRSWPAPTFTVDLLAACGGGLRARATGGAQGPAAPAAQASDAGLAVSLLAWLCAEARAGAAATGEPALSPSETAMLAAPGAVGVSPDPAAASRACRGLLAGSGAPESMCGALTARSVVSAGPSVAGALAYAAEAAVRAWGWTPTAAGGRDHEVTDDVGEASLAGAPVLSRRRAGVGRNGVAASTGGDEDEAAAVEEEDSGEVAEWGLAAERRGETAAEEEALVVERSEAETPAVAAGTAGARAGGRDPAALAAWEAEVERHGHRLRARPVAVSRRWRPAAGRWASVLAGAGGSGGVASAAGATGGVAGGQARSIAAGEQRAAAAAEALLGRTRSSRRDLEDASRVAAVSRRRVEELASAAAGAEDEANVARERLAERSRSTGDASPLVRIRAALATLRAEARRMAMRTGVAQARLGRLQLAHPTT